MTSFFPPFSPPAIPFPGSSFFLPPLEGGVLFSLFFPFSLLLLEKGTLDISPFFFPFLLIYYVRAFNFGLFGKERDPFSPLFYVNGRRPFFYTFFISIPSVCRRNEPPPFRIMPPLCISLPLVIGGALYFSPSTGGFERPFPPSPNQVSCPSEGFSGNLPTPQSPRRRTSAPPFPSPGARGFFFSFFFLGGVFGVLPKKP